MSMPTRPELLQQINGLLATASSSRSPFTLMQLATIGLDGAPKLRTIVLRHFDGEGWVCAFTADARSAKMAEIKVNPRVALTGLHAEHGVQLRLSGVAEIVLDDDARQGAWNRLKAATQLPFRSSILPGTVIPEPGYAALGPAEERNGNKPPDHFEFVHVRIGHVDWLDVSANPHERCVFVRLNDGWSSNWVAP